MHCLKLSNAAGSELQRPWRLIPLGRCLSWLATHFRAVGCNARGDPVHTPVASHCRKFSGKKRATAVAFPQRARHLPVALPITQYTSNSMVQRPWLLFTRPLHLLHLPHSLPDSSNARAQHFTRALACQLTISCSADDSNARGTCPLGRWDLLFPIFRFWVMTTEIHSFTFPS